MGRNRDIVDKIKAEVAADPMGLSYKEADCSWKSVDDIWLLGTTENQDEPDHERKTARHLVAEVGPAEAKTILDAFGTVAAGHSGFAVVLGALNDYGENGGLDFASLTTIAALDQLETDSVLSPAQVALLKGFGVQKTSRFAQLGIPTDRKHHVRRAKEEIEA